MDPVREQLLPLLEGLCLLAHEDDPEQAAFFDRIRAGVEAASHPDDLAGPFMELSTSAFRGFAFSAPVAMLLDQVLDVAQSISTTLSAGEDGPH